jgi:SAM-dependent methyltransferase
MSTSDAEYGDTAVAPRPQFKSFFIGSGLGYVCYYFFRNDWVWARLTDQERSFVKQQNSYWNNNNPGYRNPEEYQGQGGRSFRTSGDRTTSWEGKQLQLFLEQARPRRILEIGPGSGYYTRQIIEFGSVEEYVASDINLKFLSYIEGALSERVTQKAVRTKFVEIERLDSSGIEVDAIIMLSALHHIPDRAEFIRQVSRYLVPGGILFFYEPMHSLVRILQLGWSFIVHRWYFTSVVQLRNNYMTHHFCTVAETKSIAERAGMDFMFWEVKSKLPQKLRCFAALFSSKMVAALRKVKSS